MRESPCEDRWAAALAARPTDFLLVHGIGLTKHVGAEEIGVAGGGEVAAEGSQGFLVQAHRASDDVEAPADSSAVVGKHAVGKRDGAAGNVDATAVQAGGVAGDGAVADRQLPAVVEDAAAIDSG